MPGLLESAYRVCSAYEIQKLGLTVVQEKPIPVVYEGIKLDCGFRADLFVANLVIVECKAKEKIHLIDGARFSHTYVWPGFPLDYRSTFMNWSSKMVSAASPITTEKKLKTKSALER